MRKSRQLNRGFFGLLALPTAIGLALSGGSTIVFAQDEGQQEYLDEIIVTSRYREERLQQTPIAITAISGEELEVRAFVSAYEVGYTVPNASLRPAQAAFGNTMTAYIRGIGQYDFNFAFEPGVGIYIDDVYHPWTMGSQIDLLDIERVEVLRGPQGTLFGRGAIGGAIRYVSKQPQGDGSGAISLTVGEFNRVDVRGSYDFALVEDKLFARVAGVSRSREGYQEVYDFPCLYPSLSGGLTSQVRNRGSNCFLGTQGGEDITGARAAVRWAARDDLDITVTAEFLDDNSEARADTLTNVSVAAIDGFWRAYTLDRFGIVYDDRFLPSNPFLSFATYDDPINGRRIDPVTSFQKTAISGVLDWDINDDTNLKLIVANAQIDSELATDADASPINVQTVDGFTDLETTTFEARLTGTVMDNIDYTVGGFVYDGSMDSWQNVSIPYLTIFLDMFLPNAFGPCFGPFPPCTITMAEAFDLLDSDPETYTFVKSANLHDASHESIFAHVVFNLSDQLAVSVGGRYSQDEKIVAFDNTRVVNPRTVVEDDRTDWKVGVDYKFSDEFLLYGSVATGYRPGAYNPRPFQVTQVVAVEAEDAISYEIGAKMDLLDNRLRVNAAAFVVDWKKRILPAGGTECILLDPGPPPVYDEVPPNTPGATQDSFGRWCFATVPATFYENQPADITGFEAEIFWRPTENLSVSGQYGFIDWDSPDVTDCPPTVCVRTDLPIQVPEDNWSLSIAYDFPLAGGSTLTPRVDVYGQSEICFSNLGTNSCTEGYELVNASLMWMSPDADWDIQIGATNITDEFYWLNVFDLSIFGQQTVEKQPGRPSEFFLTVRRHFQ